MVLENDSAILQNMADKIGQIISEDVPEIEDMELKEVLGVIFNDVSAMLSSITEQNNEQNGEGDV